MGKYKLGRRFFKALKANGKKTPLDFFSWHAYISNPKGIVGDALSIRRRLDQEGYHETESILNEYNYLGYGWSKDFDKTLEEIAFSHGATFLSTIMAMGQKLPLDMLMYYDARLNTGFNGLFAPYTYKAA